jgi:hypothetical protein
VTTASHEGNEANKRWSAKRWEQAQSSAFEAWRCRTDGPAINALSTLCQATSNAVRWMADPSDVAAHLQDVLTHCNELAFDDPAQVAAYSLLHLSDRYGRAYQVFELLFEVGLLPIRRDRVSILEVGAGPGPCSYAAIDFYDHLAQWNAICSQSIASAPAADCHPMDSGSAWGSMMHTIFEQLMSLRIPPAGAVDRDPSRFPFGMRYTDFEGFSILDRHNEERARLARIFQGEIDVTDDEWPTEATYSTAAARRLANDAPSEIPSAYDLVFVSNFITERNDLQKFRSELRDLARLTPGGS